MRLFHFSEEGDIDAFEPVNGLVWAIDEEMAVNYLFPRDCPRVTFGVWEPTDDADRAWFESVSSGARRVLLIESEWLDRFRSARLFRHEFEPDEFQLQDEAAGYWTSAGRQKPIAMEVIDDLELAIEAVGGRLIAEDSLWPMIDRVVDSSFRFSVIRQRNALGR